MKCICNRCGQVGTLLAFGCSLCFDAQESAEIQPDGSIKRVIHTRNGAIEKVWRSPVTITPTQFYGTIR